MHKLKEKKFKFSKTFVAEAKKSSKVSIWRGECDFCTNEAKIGKLLEKDVFLLCKHHYAAIAKPKLLLQNPCISLT